MAVLLWCLFGLCLVNYAGLAYFIWRYWEAIKAVDDMLWHHITKTHGGKP
jgi:hypothetical protein